MFIYSLSGDRCLSLHNKRRHDRAYGHGLWESTDHGHPRSSVPDGSAHKAPRENRPAVEVFDLPQHLDELDHLEVVVEDKLTASDTAVDMVGSSRKK